MTTDLTKVSDEDLRWEREAAERDMKRAKERLEPALQEEERRAKLKSVKTVEEEG